MKCFFLFFLLLLFTFPSMGQMTKSKNIFTKIWKKIGKVPFFASTNIVNDEQIADQLDEQFLMDQISEAKEWALANGLVTKPFLLRCDSCDTHIDSDDFVQFVSFSLFPSLFPRALFQQAVDVQTSLQLLYFRAMRDFEFLKEMHRDQLETTDDFRQTVNFIENLYKDGFKQPLTLFCQRSDYMVHESEENNVKKLGLRQVEVNAGPIGGIGASPRVTSLHRRVLSSVAGADASESVVPPNHTDTMTAKALLRAWHEFGNSEAVILFLHLTSGDVRIIESRQVQHEVERISNGQTKCVFLTLSEAIDRLKLDPNNFSLILDDKILVAVALHRYSYATRQQLAFTRQIVRRSTAIQDSYRSLLAHTKRMQQIYTMPGVLERFFPHSEEEKMVKAIREVFTKSWSIGEEDEEAEEIIKVKMNAENYVMKWNECSRDLKDRGIFFGEEIAEKLDKMTKAERNNFIIMERIRPMAVKNHLVFPHSAPLLNVEVTPELGIFGCLLGNIEHGTVLHHFTGEALLMKTKLASENEGGIWKGKSVMDSPLLV